MMTIREKQGHKELYKMGFDGACIEKIRHLTSKQYIEFQKILQQELHKDKKNDIRDNQQ
jgi:hypothetical protein